jgi:hypothetical protein
MWVRQMNRSFLSALLLLLSGILLGCLPQTAPELQGSYFAKMNSDTLELLLKPDGRFEQILHVANRPAEEISQGTWNYYANESRIDFTNLRNIDVQSCSEAGGCRIGEAGSASLPVERNFVVGSIRIGAESEMPYIKRD